MPKCNSTLSDEWIGHEEPIFSDVTFHHFGLFLSAGFGLIALSIGMFLICMHATHYLKPWEQRHIIRILFLIPVYSVVSFLSYLYYRHAIYFDILEGCYEAFAISSFFTLLCHYIAPNLHDQKDYFRTLTPKNWFWGVFGLQKCTGGQNKGPLRKPRSGLTWFNVIWVGVFQYCFIRVFFTIVAVLAQINDVYCQDSLSPAFAHVWVQVFECISVTIAMFCLIQFYIQLREDLAVHKPFLKVLCIKLVIFFSFWQSIVITFATSANGPLQPTKSLAYPDISIGIPATLLCIEMAIFAVMHIFAFPWKPYSIKHTYSDPVHEPGFAGGEDMHYKGFFPAVIDAFNPWDIIKMTARGFRWLFVGVRKRHEDVSYNPDFGKDGAPGYEPVGPTFAATGEAATELRDSKDAARGPSRTFEEDRAGLLTYQGPVSRMTNGSPYQPYAQTYASPYSGESQVDLGGPPSMPQRPGAPPGMPPRSGLGVSAANYDAKPSEFDSEDDTTYHPGQGPTAGAGRADAGGAVHPAYRADGSSWPLSGEAERLRPTPAYPPDPSRR